jgi:hypothetical protein
MRPSHSKCTAESRNAGTNKPFFKCALPTGELCKPGAKQMAFIILGVAIGALCVFFRYPILMTLGLGGLLAVGAGLSGIALHIHPGLIAAEVFGSIAASQLTYVAIGLTQHLAQSRKLTLQVQAAIAQQLSTELEVPRSLPPEISRLVAQLRSA